MPVFLIYTLTQHCICPPPDSMCSKACVQSDVLQELSNVLIVVFPGESSAHLSFPLLRDYDDTNFYQTIFH